MYNKIDLREVPAERLKEISLDLVDIDAQAPEFEPNRQFYFMAKARDYVKRKSAELGRPMTFFTQTFGWPEEKEDFDADISDIRVLLVEDNELNVEIAEFMLTENGAKVETVNNGLEAVQHFEDSEPGTYDVILMDVMMPVMDGLTATRTIRALDRQDAKTIPIIAMTANAFREDAEKCMEAGMNAHLAKPLDDEKIKQTISEELRKQNACHE